MSNQLVNITVVNVRQNRANKLMDQAVKIENKIANKGNQVFNDHAWWSADDTFNDIRYNYSLQSYEEALDTTNFILSTSTNDDDQYFAKLDLKALKKLHGVPYVAMGNSEKQSYVPASYNNEIIPFLRAVQKHDPAFRKIDLSSFDY